MNSSATRSRQVQLQGPRPTPLMISRSSSKITKKSSRQNRTGPVIVYLKSPDVIHVRPEEFMSLVQKLTGKPEVSTSNAGNDDGVKKGLVKRDRVMELDGGYEVGQQQKFAVNNIDVSLQSAFSNFCLNIYNDW